MNSAHRHFARLLLALMLTTQCISLYANDEQPSEKRETVDEDQKEQKAKKKRPVKRTQRRKKDNTANNSELSVPEEMWKTIKRHPKRCIAGTIGFGLVLLIGVGANSVRHAMAATNKFDQRLQELGVYQLQPGEYPRQSVQTVFQYTVSGKENGDPRIEAYFVVIDMLDKEGYVPAHDVAQIMLNLNLENDEEIGEYFPSDFLNKLPAEILRRKPEAFRGALPQDQFDSSDEA